MNATANDSVSWTLPPVARSVVDARRHVREALDTWHLDDLCDVALLLTSELVTNSLLHARSAVQLMIEHRTPSTLRVAVSDNSAVAPAMRPRSQTATTGRGMQLLATLADAWDTEVTEVGKTVWFTVSRARDPWAGYHKVDWLGEAE